MDIPTKSNEIHELTSKVNYLIERVDLLFNNQVSPMPKSNLSDDEIEDTVDVEGAAKIIKRSKSTVYTKSCRGELPSWNANGRLLFSKKALLQWLNENKEKSETSVTQMKTIRNRYKRK